MIAEGAFELQLVEFHVAFENDLSVGGNFQVDGFAFHQFDRLLAQESGNDELFDIGWCGDNGGEGQSGVGANDDRDIHPAFGTISSGEHGRACRASHQVDRGASLPASTSVMFDGLPHAVAIMFRRDFLALPMHSRRLLVVHLHAIHAHIALPRFRIASDHTRQRNKSPGIFWPALQNGKIK